MNRENIKIGFILGVLSSLFLLVSCKFENAEPATQLHFSADTIYMDTLVTQLGSPTNKFLVYNKLKKKIKIQNISMAKGSNSEFIININGMGTGAKSDIEIAALDSIFIFIQAKLNKTGIDTIVSHNDYLVFTLADSKQTIPVVSWGRDATFLSSYKTGTTTWTAGSSILIKDSVIVEEGAVLTIEQGVNVFFRPGANFIVRGTVKVQGTIEKPVIFEGYRIEYAYRQLPGQWGSLIFENASNNNEIKNAVIRNGTNGIQLKSAMQPIDISLENVIINYMSYAGLLCKSAKVEARNCVIANCSSYGINISEGGDYRFTHITISNYSNQGKVRNSPSVYINNYKNNSSKKEGKELKNALFENSIIVGYNSNETEADKTDDALFNLKYLNCIIKQSGLNDYMNSGCLLYDSSKKLLIDSQNNFCLDTLSQAIDKADVNVSALVPIDLRGKERLKDGKPDIGAYEYFYEPKKNKK